MTSQEILPIVLSSLTTFHEDGEAAISRLVSVYADDVVFEDPLQRLEGKHAFVAMNRRLLERSRSIRFDVLNTCTGEDQIFLTWRMKLEFRHGPTLDIPGATHLRLGGGLVVEHRDYWDLLGAVAHSFPLIAPIYRRIMSLFG